MVVEGHLGLAATDELKAIVAPVPVNGGPHMQPSALDVALQGGEKLDGLLELLVVLGTVERVGAEALCAESGVPGEMRVEG